MLTIDLSYLKSKTLRFFLQELGLKICPEMQPYGSKSVKFLRLREQNDTTYARRTKGKSVKLKITSTWEFAAICITLSRKQLMGIIWYPSINRGSAVIIKGTRCGVFIKPSSMVHARAANRDEVFTGEF